MASKPNSKAPLGEGGRFAVLARSTGSKSIAASVGRKKYGNARFNALARMGRKKK